MTDMDDLATWLGAQLDEDERVARRVEPNQAPLDLRVMVTREGSEPFLVVDSARVLAEVDTKRRILDEYGALDKVWQADADPVNSQSTFDTVVGLESAIKLLALPYASRPGYREEWRP